MIALAALLMSAAVFVLIPPRPEPRLRRLVRMTSTSRTPLTSTQRGYGAAIVLALGSIAVLGVMPGILVAAAAIIVVPRLMSRLESAESRRYRESLDRQLPDVLDALTSLLEAGALPAQALQAVSDAWGEPIGIELTRVSKALRLGAGAEQAWAPTHASMQVMATAMTRSAESGAPLALVLAGASSDARREHRVRVEIAARSAGVKAVAPLAACFLPAFFLMGVAPIIASFVEQILHS